MKRLTFIQKIVLAYQAAGLTLYLLGWTDFEHCAMGFLVCNTCLMLDKGKEND